MPFHIPAVSQLVLSMDWRGGHIADWKGQLCVPGAKPRDGRSRIPQHQANAAPAHPAPSYRHWLRLFRLSRSLLLLLALLGGLCSRQVPAPPQSLPCSEVSGSTSRPEPRLPGNAESLARCQGMGPAEAAMAVRRWGSVHRLESPSPGRIPCLALHD